MSLFRQIMSIAAGIENYQKIVVNPKNDGAECKLQTERQQVV